MIVAHCFGRKIRSRWYLMCETSSTEDAVTVYPTPEAMLEFDPAKPDAERLALRVRDRILSMRKDLEHVETLWPETATPERPVTFDLAFRVKSAGLGAIFGMARKGK